MYIMMVVAVSQTREVEDVDAQGKNAREPAKSAHTGYSATVITALHTVLSSLYYRFM